MGGDKLASGGRSASFNAPAQEMEGTDIWDHDTFVTSEPEPPKEDSKQAMGEQADLLASGSVNKPSVGYEGEPVGDSILVERVEREHSSNLVLPDSLKAKSDLGYVVAVGSEVKRTEKGKLILFDKFASHGADISLIDGDGVERHYLLLKDYDVLMALRRVSSSQTPQSSSETNPSEAADQTPAAE
jgi:co-chaperonin GroES (HSP10)